MARTAYSVRKRRSSTYRRNAKRPRRSYRRTSRRVRGVTRITKRSPRTNNSVFSFKRKSVPQVVWLQNGSTDDVASIFVQFNLTNVSDLRYIVITSSVISPSIPGTTYPIINTSEYSSMRNLFRYFRVCKIKMSFTPSMNAGTPYNSGVEGASSGAIAGNIVYDTVRDYQAYNSNYGNSAAGYNASLQTISSRVKSIYKHHKMYFTPSVLSSIPIVNSGYSQHVNNYKQWYPLDAVDGEQNIPFNGFVVRARCPKQSVPQSTLSVFDGTDFPPESTQVPIGMINFTYYFQCKYQQ